MREWVFEIKQLMEAMDRRERKMMYVFVRRLTAQRSAPEETPMRELLANATERETVIVWKFAAGIVKAKRRRSE